MWNSFTAGPVYREAHLLRRGSRQGGAMKITAAGLALVFAAAPSALGTARRTLATRPQVVGAVSHLLLPTSVSAPGRFGAFYKTKISIFNATGNTYTIRAGLSQSSGEAVSASIPISPGETVTYDDFL